MEIIHLRKKNALEVARKTVFFLERGGVILYPTETLYGLGADAWKKSSILRVKKIKKIEAKNHPFIVLSPSFEMAEQWVCFPRAAKDIAKKHWPGPLTILLSLKKTWFSQFSHLSEDNTIAIRVSSHPFLLELFNIFRHPLVSTSANRTGENPIKNIREAKEWFEAEKYSPDLFIDAGIIHNILPSTILDGRNNELKVIRQGKIRL